jgi:hypothetical protein
MGSRVPLEKSGQERIPLMKKDAVDVERAPTQVSTAGNVSSPTVQRYIEAQGKDGDAP